MKIIYISALLLLAFIPGIANSQYVWEKLAFNRYSAQRYSRQLSDRVE